MYTFPTDRYYDPVNHMWAMINSDGTLSVGIDSLGLQSLGDIAYLTLADLGSVIRRGQPMGTMEAAKMTGELIAPISGTLIARNDQVLRNPDLVNRDNYGAAWLVKIKAGNWQTESGELVHGDGVPTWANAEIERYRQKGWIND